MFLKDFWWLDKMQTGEAPPPPPPLRGQKLDCRLAVRGRLQPGLRGAIGRQLTVVLDNIPILSFIMVMIIDIKVKFSVS